MQKQTVNVWIATHSMFTHGSDSYFTQRERPKIEPFYFQEVKLKDTVDELFKFALGVGLIPHNIEQTSCFFNVQVFSDGEAMDQEILDTSNFDVQKACKQEKQNRKIISKEIIDQAERDTQDRENITNFNLSMYDLLYPVLEESQEIFTSKFQIRIYFLWKQAFFHLKSDPKKLLSLIVRNGETFDCLYKRAINSVPQIHQNIRTITFRSGPDIKIYFLTKHRFYHPQDKKLVGSSNGLGIDRKLLTTIEPSAKIVLKGSLYELDIFQKRRKL